MNVHWGKGLPGYFTHAVECTNFERVTIDGLHEQMPGNSNTVTPTIYLHKGKTSDVKGVTSTDKSKKLVIKDDRE